MQELEMLELLEKTSSTTAKTKLLKRMSEHERFAFLLDAALNYKRKFWIKKFSIDIAYTDAGDKHSTLENLLIKLESREIVGNTALGAVEQFFSTCNDLQAKWYSRVLRKDLKIGVSISTANKCGFNIPEFDVQLAKDGHQCSKLEDLLRKGLSGSPKLDGYRCLAIIEDGIVTLHTRNGEVFQNFPSIEESLASMYPTGCIVFDGEIMSNDFNKTQRSAFASKRGTVVGDVKYHIFDMIPYDEWSTEDFKTTAFTRYTALSDLFDRCELKPDNITIVPRVEIRTTSHIADYEEQFIAAGYEGLMANPDIPYYKGKKSNKMLKFKTFQSMDCKIVDSYLGDASSKYSDVLGGFTVMQENGVICDVGSGYDDSERRIMWEKRDEFAGRVMEVKYQNLSDKDQRMRFPVFVRWRKDKE